jgi:hypothetical protein
MGTIFGWFQIVIAFFNMLTKAVDAVSAWLDQRRANQVKDSIDESLKTGNQIPIEEGLGHPNPGGHTHHEIPELKTRPVRDRSHDD